MNAPSDHEAKLDRIREVAMTVREPRNAGEIAEVAGVARNTAVKYLQQLVEADRLVAVQQGRETRYYPDPVTQYFDQVRDLIESHGKAELTNELAAIREDIDEWKTEYDVQTPDELRASVGDEDLSTDERRRRIEIVEDWEYFERQADLIKQAIQLYDPVEAARTSRTATI